MENCMVNLCENHKIFSSSCKLKALCCEGHQNKEDNEPSIETFHEPLLISNAENDFSSCIIS